MSGKKTKAEASFVRGYVCAAAYIAVTERDDRKVRDMLSPLGINNLSDLRSSSATPYDIKKCEFSFLTPSSKLVPASDREMD